MRIPCIKCGTEVLEATARANNGLCAPCARGGGFCKICGTRVWQSNKLGEHICMDCMLKRRDKEIVKSSGISLSCPDEIDWQTFSSGISSAIQNCFARIAASNRSRSVTEVVIAYRIGEGVRVEPCVTFTDGEYLNASLKDDVLLDDLNPFDTAFTRIIESLDEIESDSFVDMLDSRIPQIMQDIFVALQKNDFELDLTDGSTQTLKEF